MKGIIEVSVSDGDNVRYSFLFIIVLFQNSVSNSQRFKKLTELLKFFRDDLLLLLFIFLHEDDKYLAYCNKINLIVD